MILITLFFCALSSNDLIFHPAFPKPTKILRSQNFPSAFCTLLVPPSLLSKYTRGIIFFTVQTIHPDTPQTFGPQLGLPAWAGATFPSEGGGEGTLHNPHPCVSYIPVDHWRFPPALPLRWDWGFPTQPRSYVTGQEHYWTPTTLWSAPFAPQLDKSYATRKGSFFSCGAFFVPEPHTYAPSYASFLRDFIHWLTQCWIGCQLRYVGFWWALQMDRQKSTHFRPIFFDKNQFSQNILTP